MKIEATAKYSGSKADANSRESTRTLTVAVPVKVPAGKLVTVNGSLSRHSADIPFTFTVRRTLGDGTVSDTVESGTWRAVEYAAGEFRFTTASGI